MGWTSSKNAVNDISFIMKQKWTVIVVLKFQ